MKVARTLAVLVLLIAVAGCADEGSSAPPAGPSPGTAGAESGVAMETLRRVEWQLQEVTTADGQTIDVRAADATMRIDGTDLWAEACNSQRGSVQIRAEVLRFANVSTTEKGCDPFSPEGQADEGLFSVQDQWLSWSLEGDRLELTLPGSRNGSRDISLRYTEADTVNPISAGRGVVSGAANGAQYRVSLAEGGNRLGLVLEASLVWAGADERPWSFRFIDVGAEGEPLHSLASAELSRLFDYPDPARRAFVASFVPTGTARVVHQAGRDVERVELELVDVGNPDFLVAAGFTWWQSQSSTLTAYDAAGEVLASWP